MVSKRGKKDKSEKKIKVIEKSIKITNGGNNSSKNESELEEDVEENDTGKFQRFEREIFSGKKIIPILDKVAQAPEERDLETELVRINNPETGATRADTRRGDYIQQSRTDYIRNTAETDIQRRRRESSESEGRKEVVVQPNILGMESSRRGLSQVRQMNWDSNQRAEESDKGEYVVRPETFDIEDASAFEGIEMSDRKYRRRH